MSNSRLFKLLIALGLVLALALTVREAVATTIVTSEGNAAKECASLPSQYSIHSEYMKEADMWIFRTEEGPTGVDGGLLSLLSNYRACSR